MEHEKITRQVRDLFAEQTEAMQVLSTESCAICKKCAYPDAVSYTHLDVYKRQYLYSNREHEQISLIEQKNYDKYWANRKFLLKYTEFCIIIGSNDLQS